MTENVYLLTNFKPCKHQMTIRIADGPLSRVVGMGSTHISKNITLDYVLYVSKLDCNLLSISKITKDKNFIVGFLTNKCIFQDLTLGTMIGNADMRHGLYILKTTPKKQRKPQRIKGQACSASNSMDEKIMLTIALAIRTLCT